MKGYAPPDNIAVRDCLDDEISDDVDDDVFIRDGKIGRYSEDKGLKRPLMSVPRRHKYSKPIMRKRTKCWKCCEPFCYGLAAITILLGELTTPPPSPTQRLISLFHPPLPPRQP